jgi:glycosyltransferase involved in cell wall biosynthesis
MNGKPKYSIVVPVYNEEEVVGESYKRLKTVMDQVKEPYEIIFVNDGSRDRTGEILKQICEGDPSIKLIMFSRNFGHQTAITAGMDYSGGRAVVVIDADLQDPPELIPKMIDEWKKGFDVVYGKRIKRKGEGLFKRMSASLFYRFLRRMTNVDIPVDVGDFRLIDRKVCDELRKLKEMNRFVRGLVSWTGFKQTACEYVREERFAGVTKYPLAKMIRFVQASQARDHPRVRRIDSGIHLFTRGALPGVFRPAARTRMGIEHFDLAHVQRHQSRHARDHRRVHRPDI